jgi:hypothetical protein
MTFGALFVVLLLIKKKRFETGLRPPSHVKSLLDGASPYLRTPNEHKAAIINRTQHKPSAGVKAK